MEKIDSNQYLSPDDYSPELETMLYARHVEIENFRDLEQQRGTPIPALFSQFYKYIQNPSSVSIETYKRMIDTDDTIGSGVDFLTTCLMARLGMYQHESPEITEWVNNRLEEIESGWFNIGKEILSACWAGFYVGEKVWANTDNGFTVERIVPLPPSTMLFETDREGRLTADGILQYQRNYNPLVLSQGIGFFGGAVGSGFTFAGAGIRPDPFAKLGDLPFPMRTANTYNYLSIRIPKQKCIHYAFDAQGKFGNPYGRSLLRRCYKYYTMKDAFLAMMAIALDRKGTPLTIIYADPNTALLDPNKTSKGVNAKGNRNASIRADEAARAAFRNVHNDSTIILPGKKDEIFGTDFVPQSSNTEAFIAAIDLCNKSILRALLIPALIFGNGDGTGSFALGQEHSKTFDKILDGMNAGFEQIILQQLIKEMLAYNFPKSAWEKDGLGGFAKRDLSQDEKEKEFDMLEKAVNMGAVDINDLNDLNYIRERAGLEPRNEIIEQPLDIMGMGDDDGGLDGEAVPGNKKGGAGSAGAKQPNSKGGAAGKPGKAASSTGAKDADSKGNAGKSKGPAGGPGNSRSK